MSEGEARLSAEVKILSVGAYGFSVGVDRLSVEVDWGLVGLYWKRGLRMQIFFHATSLEVEKQQRSCEQLDFCM